MGACEGVNQYYIRSGCKFASFSLHLRVCSYRFLQERPQVIPTQQQAISRKISLAILREGLRRSSHCGDEAQMIFDPWSNTLILETSAVLGIPWSWTVGRPPKNTRTQKLSATLGTFFYGEEPKRTFNF